MDPKELEDKVKELEKYKREEEKAKMKEEAQRFKELKHAKKSLQAEIGKTKRVAKKKEGEVAEVTKVCDKLQDQTSMSHDKQIRMDEKFKEHIETVTTKQSEHKTDMTQKMDDIGYVKGRLAHLNFALKSLESNMIVPFESTAPPPGAKTSPGGKVELGETETLQQEVEDLRDEATHLEEENRQLREELEAARAALRQDVEACEIAKAKAAAAASAAATAAANAAAVAARSTNRSPSPVHGSGREMRIPATTMAGVRTTISSGIGRQRVSGSPIGSPNIAIPPLLGSSRTSPPPGAAYAVGGASLVAGSGLVVNAGYAYGAPPAMVMAGDAAHAAGYAYAAPPATVMAGGMAGMPGYPGVVAGASGTMGTVVVRSTSPGPHSSPRPASAFPWAQNAPQMVQSATPGVSPLMLSQGSQFGATLPPLAQPMMSPTSFVQGAQAYPGPSPRAFAMVGGMPMAPPPAFAYSAPPMATMSMPAAPHTFEHGGYRVMGHGVSSAGTPVIAAAQPFSNFGPATAGPMAAMQPSGAPPPSQRQISSGPASTAASGQAGDSSEQWIDRRSGETRHRGSFIEDGGGAQAPPVMPKPNATPSGFQGVSAGGASDEALTGQPYSFAQIAHKATAAALREYRETHTGAA